MRYRASFSFSWLRVITRNPWTFALPLVVVLVIGWRHYTYVGLALSMPGVNGNILPNGDFGQFDSAGVPLGWEVYTSGDTAYETGRSGGYAGGTTFRLQTDQYKDGDVTLVSPKITVQPHQRYLYKGYYKSNVRFAFLARYYYADGTNKLVYLQDYRDGSGTWSTVSDAFDTGNSITAVQLMYKMTSTGLLEVNGVYLEPKQNVYIAPSTTGQNLIPNSQLAADTGTAMPGSWTPYSSGDNTTAFAYDPTDKDADLQIQVSNYKNGEAKWEYPAVAVTPHQYFHFGVAYQSDVPVDVVAEYVMQDGQRQFDTVATLAPASDWTDVTYPFEAPPGAQTMFVSVVLNSDGRLTTRDYTLADTTKSGEPDWKRPLVSITFDDGWESADTFAEPVLKSDGYKATFYINPSSIETPDFMTAAELTTLTGAGNEIAAHGYAHDDMTAIDEGALGYQLHEGRDYLRQAGFSVNDFATPYGNSDSEVQWYARQYFKTLRSTESGINTRQNLDPYALKVLYADTSTSKTAVAAALQQTRADNGWLVLVYHRVGTAITPRTTKVEDTTVTTKDFVSQMDLVKQSNITVLPVTAAYDEVQKQ